MMKKKLFKMKFSSADFHQSAEKDHVWIISMQKVFQDKNWFILEILMVKESCNLTGWEVHQATPNQKW